MKEVFLPQLTVSKVESDALANLSRKRARWIFVLLASTIFAVSAMLTGLVISALVYLEAIESARIASQIGTLLIIAAFPLMMFGAHALDEIKAIERDKKAMLRENKKLSHRSN